MFPNFNRILQLENNFLSVALYTATGDERKRLEAAFPEYYSDNKEDFRVPASVVRDLMRTRGKEYWENEIEEGIYYWWEPNEIIRLNLGMSFWWRTGDDPIPPPPEVWAQLEGKSLSPLMPVTYMGEDFYVAYILFEQITKRFPAPKMVGKPIKALKKYAGINLGLISAKLIDPDS